MHGIVIPYSMNDLPNESPYFDMRGIGYEYIGTKKLPDGGYIFTERAEVPEYARHLKEKIHIVDSEKMNSVGNGKYALSMR